MPGHCGFVPVPEICDTTTTRTCIDEGFFGGTLACTGCFLDTTNCDVCPPNSRCAAFAPFDNDRGIAASGARVAVAGFTGIVIFEGLTEITRTPIDQLHAITGIPGGWLVVSGDPATLTSVSLDGVAGTPHPIFAEAQGAKIVHANGRVFFGFRAPVGDPPSADLHMLAVITDVDGSVLVPQIDLTVIFGQDHAVTTDGTRFFVAGDNALARVAANGTHTLVTTQVLGEPMKLAWGGTVGWLVGGAGAQRFAATGALVGPNLPSVGGLKDYLADGDDLLQLLTSQSVAIQRVDAAGTLVKSTEVGGGSPFLANMVRVGSDVFVAWSLQNHLQVALVNP
jgi:hypothetical protein